MEETEGMGNINTKKCEECDCKDIVWRFYDEYGLWLGDERTKKSDAFQYVCQNPKCGYHSVLRSFIHCRRCNDTGMVPCSCRK